MLIGSLSCFQHVVEACVCDLSRFMKHNSHLSKVLRNAFRKERVVCLDQVGCHRNPCHTASYEALISIHADCRLASVNSNHSLRGLRGGHLLHCRLKSAIIVCVVSGKLVDRSL